jgi:hypothetical protein
MQKSLLIPSVIVSALVAYCVTYLVHGYVHQVLAYCYGLQDSWMLSKDSLLWLQNVRENKVYAALDQEGNYFKIGIIGFGGYVANWVLLVFAVYKIDNARGHMLNFIYWLAIWNLTAVFGYIPHQLFNSINIAHSFNSVGISVWMVYVIGGALSVIMIYVFFYQKFLSMADKLHLDSMPERWVYFIISISIVLFYSTLRYVLLDEDHINNGLHHSYWLILHEPMFWVKLVLFSLICYNINLKQKLLK